MLNYNDATTRSTKDDGLELGQQFFLMFFFHPKIPSLLVSSFDSAAVIVPDLYSSSSSLMIPSGKQTQLLKMAIYSDFSHEQL